MKSLWQTPTTNGQSALDECVQGSRTIGAHDALVLHGGGNSSIKDTITDITGAELDVIYVKGSGWDMATIKPQGFAPLRLNRLRELLAVDAITDAALVNELRCALVDASAPDPSIESLLHALLPYRAVLHSHADVIVSLTNQPDPAAAVTELFGDSVVLIPYVMPGFDLARLANELWPKLATAKTRGMVLLNHGLFTFGDTMAEAYSRHLEFISAAEAAVAGDDAESAASAAPATPAPATVDPLAIARLRRAISAHAGRPMIMGHHTDDRPRHAASRPLHRDAPGRGSGPGAGGVRAPAARHPAALDDQAVPRPRPRRPRGDAVSLPCRRGRGPAPARGPCGPGRSRDHGLHRPGRRPHHPRPVHGLRPQALRSGSGSEAAEAAVPRREGLQCGGYDPRRRDKFTRRAPLD